MATPSAKADASAAIGRSTAFRRGRATARSGSPGQGRYGRSARARHARRLAAGKDGAAGRFRRPSRRYRRRGREVCGPDRGGPRGKPPNARAAPARNPVIAKLGDIGRGTIGASEDITAFLQMLGALCIAILGVLRRPRSLRLTSLTYQLYRVGWQAIPIVALITFLIGASSRNRAFSISASSTQMLTSSTWSAYSCCAAIRAMVIVVPGSVAYCYPSRWR